MDGDFKNFIEQVRSSANIIDVIGSYVSLKKKGNKHWACCPFHGEKTPSFSVDEGKQLFYCFGCHVGGDVFKFLEKKEGYNFIEAVKFLAQRYNIPIPEREKSAQDLAFEKDLEKVTAINEWASKYYVACLQHVKVGAKAREYLTNRGITPQIIDEFQIGYAQNGYENLVDALTTKDISLSDMVFSGLALEGKTAKPYDKFRDRVMIPIKNPRGKIVGFGGRVLGDGEPKYLNTGETKFFNKRYLLFGFDLAQKYMRQAGSVVIVEGYMDAISLHAAGLRNVVASMGTAFSEQQADILKRNVGEIIFCYDSDRAGRNASVRAVSIARKKGIKVRVAGVPGAKDPDEFVRAQGLDAFRKVLDEAVPGLRFQVDDTLSQKDVSSLSGKVEAIREIIPFLMESSSEFEVNDEIRYLANKLTLDEALVADEYQKVKNKKRRFGEAKAPEPTVTDKAPPVTENKAEEMLLALLVNDLTLVPICNEKLGNTEITSPLLKKLYLRLNILYDEGRSIGDLVDLSDEESSLLTALQMEPLPKENSQQIMQDCLCEMRKSQLEKKYSVHAALAAEYEKNGDDRFLEELKICQEIRNDIKKIC